MELVIIKEGSNEWNYIWDYIAKHPINEGVDNPKVALNNDEAWQYMGSYKQDNKVIHTARHRSHPKTNNRYNLTFAASNDFNEEEIGKTIKIG